MENVKKTREYVTKAASENKVGFVQLWFSDVLGSLKSFAITVDELETALDDGKWFDGSSIQSLARVDESDLLAVPDPKTFQILPWRSAPDCAVARMFCDIVEPNGEPCKGDTRWVLHRALQRAADMGFTFYVGPELEYFYFKDSSPNIQLLDPGGYFDLAPLDRAKDLRRDTILILEKMGIPVEASHHEVAPSQHEIDLRYSDALTMADTTVTCRLVIKEVALRHDLYATFMPKPLNGENGSGMHTHQSLFRGESNAFFDPGQKYHLSDVARHYTAGLLKHAPEITILTNQWVNSYKRLIPGYEAPVYLTWARRSRADLIRVPEYKPGKERAARIEFRSPDSACNPYLAFAGMLMAGLKGMQEKYPLPPETEQNVFTMSAKEREAAGIQCLPGNLYEAIQIAEKSELLRETLGDYLFEKFLENKRIEWDRYRTHVSEYELREYLSVL
jgi:glutamine synthetase